MAKLPLANKTLGQHFLVDKNIISQITSNFEDVDHILEIGPGPGILTEPLAQKKDKDIHVIDKDQRFPEYLSKFIPEDKIHISDALEWDLEQGFKEWGWKDDPSAPIWLVSNLPYNISTPLLIKFIQSPSIKYMTLMFQREVADKVFPIDTRKGKAMNSLMALCQNYFDVELLCKVPPGAFSPPPKVDSAVLSFKRKENPTVPLDRFQSFEKFLRLLFQFKRKQMGKILKSQFSSEHIMITLEMLDLSPQVRAEALELEDIKQLFLLLVKQ